MSIKIVNSSILFRNVQNIILSLQRLRIAGNLRKPRERKDGGKARVMCRGAGGSFIRSHRPAFIKNTINKQFRIMLILILSTRNYLKHNAQ